MDLAYLLPGLVCGGMMIGCVLMMSKMHGGRRAGDSADPQEVARLRVEVARLRSEQDERSPERP